VRTDKEFVLEATKRNWQALRHAAPECRADQDLVHQAVKHDWRAIHAAAVPLLADFAIVAAAVRQDWTAIQIASAGPRASQRIVLMAVKQDWRAINFAARSLRADKEVMLAAVQQVWEAIKFAADNILADREVLLAALENHFPALEYAAESLWNDHAFVLCVVQADWTLLERASPLVRSDPYIVNAAVSQDMRALPLSNLGKGMEPELTRYQEMGVLPSWYPPEWIANPRTQLSKKGKKFNQALGTEILGALAPTLQKMKTTESIEKGSKVAWSDSGPEVASDQAAMHAESDHIQQVLLDKRDRRIASKDAKAVASDPGVKCSWRWRKMSARLMDMSEGEAWDKTLGYITY